MYVGDTDAFYGRIRSIDWLANLGLSRTNTWTSTAFKMANSIFFIGTTDTATFYNITAASFS